MLRSVDSVSEEDGMHHAYPAEFLQQLNAGGLPPACQKDGEQQLQQGQMMAHLLGYPTDNNKWPDRKERSREKQRDSRRGS